MAKLAVAAVLLLVPVAGATSPPPFTAKVARVTAADLPYSWRPGCPVGPARLRAVRIRHWDFRGRSRVGVLVVDRAVVPDVVSVFRRLYAARFPIRRMLGVEVYRGNDDASMRADNTSAFNCRYVEGTRHWSEHAYGRAIDVNTVENPYVHGGLVEPPGGRAFLDRSRRRPGMAVESGVLVRAFEAVGWGWGGRWRSAKDY
ncbi:MAG TPA: M15 family metallopeptidase, partial [Gaiellaceae bacterium]|nr:M15 family metallopeptidase [Gaiellaceae bacterium]